MINSSRSKLLLLAVGLAALEATPIRALAQSVNIVALGDSNTAGFLVGKRHAFPALVEEKLRAAGLDVDVTNRGISGDTTAGMLARLDRAVDVAMVGQPVEKRRRHLGIAKHTRPLAEAKVCGDDDAGAFVELAQQDGREVPHLMRWTADSQAHPGSRDRNA